MLAGALLGSMAWGQDSDPFDTGGGGGGGDDPFARGGRKKMVEISPEAEGFTMTFEVFSIPMAKAAEMKRSKLSQEASYAAVLEEVKAGKGLQDKLMEVRTLEGQPVTVEQIREYIYPTEYEPPEVGTLPEKLPEGFKDFEKFITPAMPSAFDTKNLGDTLEVTLSGHPDHPGKISGRVSFSHVSLEGMQKWGEGDSEVEMPKFRVQKINAAVSLTFGEPLMVGTLADPSEAAERKGHVWVAFARVAEEITKEKKEKK